MSKKKGGKGMSPKSALRVEGRMGESERRSFIRRERTKKGQFRAHTPERNLETELCGLPSLVIAFDFGRK